MERLRPHLGHVSFALGEVIYESGWRQNHIHFPTTAILDRGGLGKAVCEGYKVVKDAYDRLLAGASVYLVKPDSLELIPTIRRLLEADAG